VADDVTRILVLTGVGCRGWLRATEPNIVPHEFWQKASICRDNTV
jgi:hypothetical protein